MTTPRPHTKVQVWPDRKLVYAERQSNRTLLVARTKKIADLDRTILTDIYGHRYSRDISLEQFCPGYYYFTMI